MIRLLWYAPARFERLTNGIESRFCAAQRFIFIDFTATRFGGIPCTRFPWIRCYDFAQFLFTLFTNHFQSIFSLPLSNIRLLFRLIVLDGPLWSIWMGLFCFIWRFRVSVVKCQTAKPTRFNVNVSISNWVPFVHLLWSWLRKPNRWIEVKGVHCPVWLTAITIHSRYYTMC